MADEERDRAGVARLESRSPGADEDPYADVDLEELPDWWRRAVEEFRAHDLRPYRPPRLADGALAHEVVEELEAELGVELSFGSVDAAFRERWEVRLDGDAVAAVDRHRSPEGYTVYEVDAERFRELVREAVRGGPSG